MHGIAQFLPVSRERFEADWQDCFPGTQPPSALTLPKRATTGSAGYDIYSPLDFILEPGQTITIPTGLRVRIDEGWMLMIVPRSGLGFKYRLHLNNTVGIIDSDYFNADNEGHIRVKLTNGSPDGRTLIVHKGDAVAQGIFVPFGITIDDAAEGVRHGGFGSTSRKER